MDYDKTTKSYIEQDNAGLSKWLQEIKKGLAIIAPLELRTARDGRGGEMVIGATRKVKSFYEGAFEPEFLAHHERDIDDILFMREKGMLISPNPKTFNPMRTGGYSDDISRSDSIIKRFNAWHSHCGKKPLKHVRAATVYVFGEHMNFTHAAKAMRENGFKASDKTVKGLCVLGLEIYSMTAKKKFDSDSE